MAGQFGPDNFTVKSKGGADVAAKYLKDSAGNYVLNPATGAPYVVPADYDPSQLIAKYAALRQVAEDSSGLLSADVLLYTSLYTSFTAKFPGADDDLQRHYNGYYATGPGDFVSAFTPIASFNVGLAVAAAGLTYEEVMTGSGLQNIKSKFGSLKSFMNVDWSGAYFNAPVNVEHIGYGYSSLSDTGGFDSTLSRIHPVGTVYIDTGGNASPGREEFSIIETSNSTIIVQRLNKNLEPTETFEVYTVQPGDTLTGIASDKGTTWKALAKFNSIPDPNTIYAGEQLYVPRTKPDNNSSAAPINIPVGANQFYVDSLYNDLDTISIATGVSVADLQAANPGITANMSIAAGTLVSLPAVNNLFTATLTTNPTATTNTLDDPTQSISGSGNLIDADATHSVTGITGADVNTATGNTQAANAIISDNFRPGAQEVLPVTDTAIDLFAGTDPVSQAMSGAQANFEATGATHWIPVDPLVLDLNGDGVKLTSFADAPVLFDIDNDGGSKELTGWVSAQDGIVVIDLNNNGVIDNIRETFSEYFNGAAGTGGNAGSKPYANGFAALKSQDSNGDNQFSSLDAAWANVKVWVDADHDGVTDAGELKTLASLGITSINLAPTLQSGLVNGGNEILATGSFVKGGVTSEAQATRFIANPTGNTVNLMF